jgi:excisionase family DNA binding protein
VGSGSTGDGERLLRPSEAAALFGVSAKTVNRWADSGRLGLVRTLGGHRRYLASDVETLLEGQSAEVSVDTRVEYQQPTSQPRTLNFTTGRLPPQRSINLRD